MLLKLLSLRLFLVREELRGLYGHSSFQFDSFFEAIIFCCLFSTWSEQGIFSYPLLVSLALSALHILGFTYLFVLFTLGLDKLLKSCITAYYNLSLVVRWESLALVGNFAAEVLTPIPHLFFSLSIGALLIFFSSWIVLTAFP